jgi:pimeloyl-ACP methyl ester carboxylesterase
MVALEPLVDPRLAVGHDFSSPARTMLIAFAAMSRLKPPPFHLFEATTGLAVKRLFVRDPARIWYQHGVSGFGSSIDEVAGSLRAIIDEHEVERLVTVGSSAGGYAALAFGSLLEADLVLSFAPQTMLDRAWLDEAGDQRWTGNFRDLAEAGGPDPRWLDLREALARERRDRTVFEVRYPQPHELDAQHAERLDGVPGLTLIPYERGAHNFIQGLRNRGELREIFAAAGLTA